jgi:hypothetical protein
MKHCAQIFTDENKITDAKDLLLKAYENTQNTTAYGDIFINFLKPKLHFTDNKHDRFEKAHAQVACSLWTTGTTR